VSYEGKLDNMWQNQPMKYNYKDMRLWLSGSDKMGNTCCIQKSQWWRWSGL